MLKLGRDELAKYPFMPDAGRHLQEYGFGLRQFGEDPALRIISRKAFERVMASTRGEIYRPELVRGVASEDRILDAEIFSFLIAIVLIKLARRPTLIQRFALSEARCAEVHLERDLADRGDQLRKTMARHMLRELFGMEVRPRKYHYLIPVHDYLMHSAVFHEREWKLVNRRVEGGFVVLQSKKTARLVRHALSVHIASRIKESAVPEMIPAFEEAVAKLAAEADRLTPRYVVTGEHPPCIKHAIDVLERGENLPHSGRFMLATFLLARGQSVEEIAPLFKNAPDYNERVTMYQLNHLAGTSGSTRYSCPSCGKLRTQNLCFAIPECDGITSPLQFGRVRQGQAGGAESVGASQSGSADATTTTPTETTSSSPPPPQKAPTTQEGGA